MNLELYTERLVMAPLAPNDVDVALEMFTDPEVTEYVDGVMSAEMICKEMSNWVKRGGNGCIGIWSVSDRKTGEKYGSVALLPMPIDEDDTDYSSVIPGKMPDGDVEIGYFLKRPAWGRGFATEVCCRLLRFAFQKTSLTEVVATFDEKNIASENVLKKAGFVDKGKMRCYGEIGPNFRITREEWSMRQS